MGITIFIAHTKMDCVDARSITQELLGTTNNAPVTALNENGVLMTLDAGTCLLVGISGQAAGGEMICDFTMHHDPEGFGMKLINTKPARWKWLKRLLGIRYTPDVQEFVMYESKDFSQLGVMWKLHSYSWYDPRPKMATVDEYTGKDE